MIVKFICHAADVEVGTAKKVDIEGRPPLAIFHLEGGFFITEDTCTHGQASLCDGEIDGFEVECPFHQGAFDVRTGEALSAPCTVPLRVYATYTEGGQVYADIGD